MSTLPLSTATTDKPHTNDGIAPPPLVRLLNWFAEHDRRFREKQRLNNLPIERLADMGMTRKDADSAFYQTRDCAEDKHPVPIIGTRHTHGQKTVS